ncbi:MAG: c-type cytochrome [Planctomycetes bacterium]|nr:c-type cytochrome [Planctomycetota bacterium]
MLTTLTLLCALFTAQNGDKAGEDQPEKWSSAKLLPAPLLSAEEELASFECIEGYSIELVAAEPLVFDPVIAMWDEHARLWVVEMTTYMLDPTGAAEKDATCCVAVITDTDGDGILDTRTEYLNDLIMPRGIVPVKEGMLIMAPPNLLLCEDLDGDLVADKRTIISDKFSLGITAPEHAPNSMLRSIDNYIYLAKYNQRWKWQDRKLTLEPHYMGAQWGLAEDRYGRKFYNHNSHTMFMDRLPAHYFSGQKFDFKSKVLQQAMQAQRPHPATLGFGVNRAYRANVIDEHGKLSRWDASCGPYVTGEDVIHAYNCEPAGNLIHVTTLSGAGEQIADYDVLTSTDERFRPVNMFGGPDDAIYIVDMYRGIFQHKVYLTSYLRKYSEARGLDEAGNNGRIWKLVKNKTSASLLPGDVNELQLVAMLRHANKWYRDCAQRLLCDADKLSLVTIEALHQNKTLHSLYILKHHDSLNEDDVLWALQSPDEQIQLHGIRLSLDMPLSGDLFYGLNQLSGKSNIIDWQFEVIAAEKTQAKASGIAEQPKSPGELNFAQICAACHGSDAKGIDKLAPSLVGSPWLKKSDGELHKLITGGVNTMPPISIFNEDQRQQIIDYLRTL